MTGVVTEFDDPRGIGVVTADDGAEYPFHCAAILDGTRSIEIGTPVSFECFGGHHGRWEATGISER